MKEIDPLMQLMGANPAPAAPASAAKLQPSFTDPGQIDWEGLASTFSLTPEEVTQLQVPQPQEGMSLGQRLQRLRPRANVGGVELQLEDNGISGRMAF